MFRISAVSTVGCPRLMNSGLLLRTEFARFIRPLESESLTISGRILFTPTFSMHDEYRFLSWVTDTWTWVLNFSMMPVQLRNLESVSLIGLKIYLFTPGVLILLQPPTLFLLLSDVHMMFLISPTILHCKPTTNVFDWFVLRREKIFIESLLLKPVKSYVTRSVLYCLMILIKAGSRSPTPIDKVQTPSTIRVSFIG